MGSSLFCAGRSTHLKIVAIALVCVFVFVLVGNNAKISETTTTQTVISVVQAGKLAKYAVQEGQASR
jgi:hypothetical protein